MSNDSDSPSGSDSDDNDRKQAAAVEKNGEMTAHLSQALCRTGNQTSNADRNGLIKRYVKNDLFREIKFIQPEDTATMNGISELMQEEMNETNHDWPARWSQTVLPMIRYEFSSRRSNLAQRMKTRFMQCTYILFFLLVSVL